MSWRETSAEIIDKVLAENKGADEKAIRKALFDAYPFGQRRYHPYKIWLDEVRRQRGLKSGKGKVTTRRKLEEWEQLYGNR